MSYVANYTRPSAEGRERGAEIRASFELRLDMMCECEKEANKKSQTSHVSSNKTLS